MSQNGNRIVAIDGHDGSGKTTLSKMLAEKIGAVYVRPFGGEKGHAIIESANKKEYDRVSEIGIEQIRKLDLEYRDEMLIFDRHWMTIFSLIPERYWEKDGWFPLPFTILCYSGLEQTFSRLAERKEEKFNEKYHLDYLDIYLRLSNRFNIPVIRTDNDTVEESFSRLLQLYKTL
jgi:energy-coupling factor transporter ATP-binding protein EcfA2